MEWKRKDIRYACTPAVSGLSIRLSKHFRFRDFGDVAGIGEAVPLLIVDT